MAVYERDGDGWVAHIPQLPGANSQGNSLDEARKNLKEAAEMIVEANHQLAKGTGITKDVVVDEILVKEPWDSTK